ncbi:substrate-binding periplasmic protein [Azospirillum sp. sgz301742]
MRDPNRRRFLTVLGAAALTAGTAHARPLDEVIERNRLRVAVYRDFHPFSYREGGVLKGIDVELTQAIAQRLNVKPDLYEHTAGEAVSDDLRVAVWRGSLFGGEIADIMMHIPYNKEFGLQNPEAVLFAPYQRELFALVRNTERVPSASLTELPEEPIGVEIDSIPDFYLLGAGGGRLRRHVVHFPSPKDAVEALKRGEVAAVLAPRSHIEGALGGVDAGLPINNVRLPGMMASSWDIGMATRENARDLTYAVGDAVTAMLEDGTMAAIFRRYGVTHTPIPVE